ncbi:cupin domain-containing protein [Consotaella aegiceratis]|uniref:cupin domain-containing protein n=1 Tax=Consotaella aegiceratis TaxID=3097961 RepID=UPI002F3F494F
MDFDVGARLRDVRREAGLSQREVARRAGVQHGMISIIEQNKSSPSVSTLRKVLSGIPMNLAQFFEADTGASDKIVFRRSELVELAGRLPAERLARGRISILQVGDAMAHNLQLLYQTYQPGADTGEEMFQHESHEGGIVLRGKLELTVGDQTTVLEPGDAYLFDSRTPHRFRNVGDEPLEFIAAASPSFL